MAGIVAADPAAVVLDPVADLVADLALATVLALVVTPVAAVAPVVVDMAAADTAGTNATAI